MPLRILILSDNASFTLYLCDLLSCAGHTPVAAAEGVEPHRAVQREKPDAVLVAVEAAKVAASAVEQRLRTPKGLRPVPTIVISECLRLETELLHVYDFIPKPLNKERLLCDLAAIAESAGGNTTPAPLTDRQYQELAGYILSRTGLHFEARNRSGLLRGVRKRMSALLMESCGAYLAYLKEHGESRKELQKLVQFLTVGETYFFRYPAQYEALKERLMARAHLREPIRIWSAGCSTGEEPYSIAMTVMEALPDWKSRDISIIATDINNHSIKRARDGVYSPWAVRSTDRRHLERYFDQVGESFLVKEEVKGLVRFHHLNLALSCSGDLCSELASLDAVFCRNVLIYFSPESAAAMVERFAAALAPSGLLFLGHAETMLQRSPQLEIRRQQNSFYYVKSPSRVAGAPAALASPPAPQQLPPQRPVRADAPDVPADPADPAARLREARELFDAEDLDRALELVQSLLAGDPDLAEALILKGFILASRGRLMEALETCSRAIAINDLLPDAYFLRGILLDACDFLAEAADEYRKALLLDHDFIMPRYYMGRVHLRLGRVNEAAREIRNSINLLTRRREEETIPYSGGLTRSVCLMQLQNALAQVA